MRRTLLDRAAPLVLAAALALSLCSCGGGDFLSEILDIHGAGAATRPPETEPSETEPAETEPSRTPPPEPFVPTEAQVLALRERVTEGMSDEEIAALRVSVVNANLGLEHLYFYEDLFERLRDPESLYWNYFEQTGEIQIGWAEDSDGTRTQVLAYNDFVVEDYVRRLQTLKESVVSGLLDRDFDRLMALLPAAKRDHDGSCVEEFYHMVHDLDYFLLRYGPEDVGPYVQDRSTVSLYYGALSVWDPPTEGE